MEDTKQRDSVQEDGAADPGSLFGELENRITELAQLVKALQRQGVAAGAPVTVPPPYEGTLSLRLGGKGKTRLDEEQTIALDPIPKVCTEPLEEPETGPVPPAPGAPDASGLPPSGRQSESYVSRSLAELAAQVSAVQKDQRAAPDRGDSGPLTGLLRSALDATTDAVLVADSKGRITIFNQRLVDMWSLPEKLLGAHNGVALLAFLASRLKTPRLFLTRIREVVNEPAGETFDVLDLADGRIVEAYSRPHQIANATAGRIWTFHDVTKLRGSEEICRESDSRFRMMVDDLHLGVVSCDRLGRITSINGNMMHLLGFLDDGEIKSANLLKWPPLVEAGISSAVRKCITARESFFGEFTYKNPLGTQVSLRLHLGPTLGANGEIKGAHGVVEDISGQKRSERLILQSQRMNMLGQMAGGVSHTFSNMLQIVSGNANMALTNLELDELDELRQNLEQILDSTKSATEAVRRLQQFGRERPHREVQRKEIFDLSDAVMEGVEMCKLWAKAKLESERIEISQALDLAPGCHVEGEPDQMAWVVLNFLKNAVEALPQGGRITIKTSFKEDQVVLLVQDNGLGIRDEDINNITQAFWTTKDSHAGMGLAVNYGIIRRHGGTMGIKRVKPRGTGFTVKLPLAVKPAPKQVPAAKETSDRTFRLLLIDDERAVVTILGKGLKKRGHTTFVALNGQEGIALLEENRVDAIVCDLGMEGMSGWDVSDAVVTLCVEKDLPKPPFILLTGWGGQLAEDEILYHPHVDRIIEKPVTIPALLEVIGEEVKKARSVAG